MKQSYEKPTAVLRHFAAADILTASEPSSSGGRDPSAPDIYWD